MAQYGGIHPPNSTKLASKPTTIAEETNSLLYHHESNVDNDTDDNKDIATRHLIAFYISHALFMGNNRCYEFAALLFTSTAFPHTLAAASSRALCAHLASVLFSPFIGHWVSRLPSQLRVVQGCIVGQRVCIAFACVGWIPLMLSPRADSGPSKDSWEYGAYTAQTVFVMLILLGMVERLSAVGNFAVVERDWLPHLSASTRRSSSGNVSVVSPSAASQIQTNETPGASESSSNLHILNGTTKTIDLVTKLVAPLAVSQLVIFTNNVTVSAVILASIQPVSCVVELYCTHLVWQNCTALQASKTHMFESCPESNGQISNESGESAAFTGATQSSKWIISIANFTMVTELRSWFDSIAAYARNPIALLSLAYILEPFSVLTLAGSMTAYLLAAKFSLSEISLARTASTVVEISSTALTPLMISYASKRSKDKSEYSIRPLLLVGIIGLFWQLLCLLPVTAIFVIFPGLDGSNTQSNYTSVTIILFVGLALSRLGPFAYTLVEQQIVQVKVAPSKRVEFSIVETGLFDVAEMARWCLLMIFSRREQFYWAASLSYVSVVLAMVMVVWFLKRTREQSEDCNP